MVAVNTAAILKDRYNVTMATFSKEEPGFTPDCKLIDLDIPPLPGGISKACNVYRRAQRLKKLKKDLNIHITLSVGSTANVANVFSRAEDRIVISVHGYESITCAGANGLVNRLVFNRADVVACVARKMARDLAAIYHIDEEKIVTLYNPYDFESINDQARQPIDQELWHPAIVTMGRLEKVKGYRHLLRIFAGVQQVIPDCRLVFVGDGSQREELGKLAADLGVADKVIFTGRQANPFAYISRCDLCVLTSINEGFPNALVEAMACGLPVVATDCKTGPREIISAAYSDEPTGEVEMSDFGILTPPFTADDSDEPELERKFTEAVLLLLTDDKLRTDYQVRGRERARAFSFAAYRENIIRILEGDPGLKD